MVKHGDEIVMGSEGGGHALYRCLSAVPGAAAGDGTPGPVQVVNAMLGLLSVQAKNYVQRVAAVAGIPLKQPSMMHLHVHRRICCSDQLEVFSCFPNHLKYCYDGTRRAHTYLAVMWA
jgi:hypothetical protein